MLKTEVKHLIENCFFTVVNIALKQDICIPLGIDPALFWVNLFLHFYENQFMAELISNNKFKTRRFHSTKSFIGDLCAMNDGREFGRTNAGVFPKDCELRLQHQGTHASILNLNFNTLGGKSVHKLYDKRDSFRFFIVMMPNIDSNTPNSIFYSTLIGETPRIACSNLHFSDFLP